jgi:serine phosphatase RsbU (regulator of sigma subunit)
MKNIQNWPHQDLVEELAHFQDLASLILPRAEDLPILPNIDYFAAIEPLKGSVCGDHLAVLNFAEYNLPHKIRQAEQAGNGLLAASLADNLDRFGILLADAAGHRIGDSVTTNFLHGAFKTGIAYELARHGKVTAGLFEMLNTIFYNRMTPEFLESKPFVTLIYGEVLNDGRFRFLSAGHPPPIVFSQMFNKIVALGDERTRSSTPLGILPSKYHVDIESFTPVALTKERYAVNEINLLGTGDFMLLYTDGLLEHHNATGLFTDTQLEPVLREAKSGTAREIYRSLCGAMHAFAPFGDDVTIAVIKKI